MTVDMLSFWFIPCFIVFVVVLVLARIFRQERRQREQEAQARRNAWFDSDAFWSYIAERERVIADMDAHLRRKDT